MSLTIKNLKAELAEFARMLQLGIITEAEYRRNHGRVSAQISLINGGK